MTEYQALELAVDARGVARLTLNRPEYYNALNRVMLQELTRAVEQLSREETVRVVVLQGAEKSFCAGADLNWFRACAEMDGAERSRETRLLADALFALDSMPKPLLSCVQGGAYGGGIGLVAVSDYALGEAGAIFALSEVRLGLVPANISPYVVRRLGLSRARAAALSGAKFSAAQALVWGLLDEVCEPGDFQSARDRLINNYLQAAPGAVAATKKLLGEVAAHTGEFAELQHHTAERLANAWAGPEGKEGVQCFLQKKKPKWQENN